MVLFDTRNNFLGNDVMISARPAVIIQSEGSSMRQDPGILFSTDYGGGRQGSGQCMFTQASSCIVDLCAPSNSLDRRFTLFSERSFLAEHGSGLIKKYYSYLFFSHRASDVSATAKWATQDIMFDAQVIWYCRRL